MLLLPALLGCASGATPEEAASGLRSGDIVFQVSQSSQAPAVALASASPITHVGLVAVSGDKVTVIEAVEPVREIPFESFVAHGSLWGVSRLREPPADPDWAKPVLKAARALKGKHYDALFQWADDRIYCSELVWKAYQRGAGIELVEPQHVRDLNLSLPPVQALIEKRTHGKGVDPDEPIVTPGWLHGSDKLEHVVGML